MTHTFKEERARLENMVVEFENTLLRLDGRIFHSKAEFLGIIGEWTVTRQMIIDLLTSLGITVKVSDYSALDGKQAVVEHTFGAGTRKISTAILRQGVMHASANYQKMREQLEKIKGQYDELVARVELASSSDKVQRDELKALKIAHEELKKKSDKQQAALEAYENAKACQIIIKNGGPYFIVNSSPKMLGTFMGMEKPIDTTPADKALIVKFKVGSLIRTRDINKALRFATQENAYHFLQHVKKNGDRLNENAGLTAKFLANYVIGLQNISY